GVVCSRDEMFVARAHLQRQRTLPGLGDDLVGLEAPADLTREPEPVEAAGREDNRVEPPLPALAQARVDVASQRLDRKGRLEPEQLRAPPDRRGTDPHPRTEPVGSAQRVARILAGEIGADAPPL